MSNPAHSSTLTLIAQFSFVLTAFVTILGWFIAAGQADKREYRKEVREHIKSVSERAQKVRDLSANYWLETEASAATAIALKAEIMALARQLQFLRILGLNIADDLIVEIRKAATGGDFESSNRKSTSEDKQRVGDVAGAIEDLLLSIDEAFYQCFPPVHPTRWKRFLPLLSVLSLTSDHN